MFIFLSADIGYERHSLTISCPNYSPPDPSDGVSFIWKKWKSSQYVNVVTYIRLDTGDELGPIYYDDLKNDRASISTSNGDLTITSLQLSPINDEATYACLFGDHERNVTVQVNGKVYNYC